MIFKLRLGGTNEFVSDIDPTWNRAYPPGKVEFVEGWNNPDAIVFLTKTSAQTGKDKVLEIEGFHTSIESI
jgi:hypothetical protein